MAFFYLSVMNEQKAKMPSGIPYIIGNETAERFSYYGMKAILTTFMTSYLLNDVREPDYFSEPDARFWVHIFGLAVYAFPLIGAFLSDALWGKYLSLIHI